MSRYNIAVLWFFIGSLAGIFSLSYTYSKAEPPPVDNRAFEMQIGLLEDRIAEQHRNNDKLRQYLLDDLLGDGRLPRAEDLFYNE